MTALAPDVLPGCSIALKCANDPSILRCLDSIDDDVSVNVVITPNDTIAGLLRDREVPFSVTDYGNIAKSTELSVQEAEHDQVIVMDSDTWFLPGSIRKIREALQEHVFAKPTLHFESSGPVTRAIAGKRHAFNNQPGYVTNPGLGMRRAEVADRCGGYIFNPHIRWTEDADLNYRAGLAGLEAAYVPEAVVCHEPVTLRHDLRAAFLYGIGKRLSIEHTPGRVPYEEFPDIAIAALKGALPSNLARKVQREGMSQATLDIMWQAFYIAGYHAQKRTNKWTLEE
jgi:hypothetical protein